MVKLKCSRCNQVGSSSKEIHIGAKVRCASCGSVFHYEPVDDGIVQLEAIPPPSASMLAPSPAAPAAFANNNVVQVVNVVGGYRRPSNPLGTAALVIGIVAVLLSCTPFVGLNMIAVLFGLLGGLVGFFGVLYGLFSRSGKSAACVGMILSFASIIIAIVSAAVRAT